MVNTVKTTFYHTNMLTPLGLFCYIPNMGLVQDVKFGTILSAQIVTLDFSHTSQCERNLRTQNI